MIKRIFFALLGLAMVGAVLGIFLIVLHHDPQARTFKNDDSGQSMFIERIDSLLDVGSDGSLTVDETLRFDLGSKTWRGLYKDIVLANDERVRSVRVYKMQGDVPLALGPGSGIKLGKGGAFGTYGYGVIKDPDRRLRIVWNVSDTGINTYRVRYVLDSAATNHNDASALLWDVWGKGWEAGVGELNVVVSFPGALKIMQPRAGELQSRVRDVRVRGGRGSFTVLNLPQQRQVQLRAAAEPLTGMARQSNNILPELEREVSEIDRHNAEQAEESADLLDRPWFVFLLPALIAALLAGVIVAVCGRTIGRDTTKKVSAGGSYQYPPEKLSPAVAASSFADASDDDLISSILLGFLQRDVFRVLPSPTQKEDISIRNLVGQTRYDPAKVAGYERPIAELLQEAIDAHPEHSPEFTKLKKHLSPKSAESKIAAFKKELKAEAARQGAARPYRGLVRRWLIGIGAVLLMTLAVVWIGLASDGGNAAARFDTMQFALPIFAFATVFFWAAIDGHAFYTLRRDQAERVRKWETYQDFFAKMDMSREYPLTVEIWDEALLYAAAFGYAEKVITNMPRTDDRGTPLTTSDTVGIGWMAGNAWAVGSLGSMSSGVSGITGMASSSSSGGGGFSGGGSGGGGGGGW